jgi:hypothetical protein
MSEMPETVRRRVSIRTVSNILFNLFVMKLFYDCISLFYGWMVGSRAEQYGSVTGESENHSHGAVQ